ncbi:uncharacterized protein BX663DRAFT_512354 [Cokeromyces recurvatus]|uniref:uncharacterized protein n=1 Tax=Cokeromyces recurvatus TaxID=90255 RepID=UPI00221FCB10|nr:uncharacterized protein BX663DRAFT_512354 [Cokeromyces recurvatus]KAI7901769.1 hypothetical protein BX663DRAFT_512354 [Cokeromyces recurvatus]
MKLPKLHVSKSSETAQSSNRLYLPTTIVGEDFVPCKMPIKQTGFSIRHTRSVSDSVLFDPLFLNSLDPKTLHNTTHDTYYSEQQCERSQTLAALLPLPLSNQNQQHSSSIISETEVELRPIVTMNIQTYMTYERLCQQQKALQHTYEEMKDLANLYEKTAAQLKETYERRVAAFSSLQRDSRKVIDEQNETERRLKEVEDSSAKLHYELKVLNEKLKDIEDNVGTFYGKVGLLERKMDDSQQSITTMLIIGNYFNHYWLKVCEWIHWLSGSKHTSKNNDTPFGNS